MTLAATTNRPPAAARRIAPAGEESTAPSTGVRRAAPQGGPPFIRRREGRSRYVACYGSGGQPTMVKATGDAGGGPSTVYPGPPAGVPCLGGAKQRAVPGPVSPGGDAEAVAAVSPSPRLLPRMVVAAASRNFLRMTLLPFRGGGMHDS